MKKRNSTEIQILNFLSQLFKPIQAIRQLGTNKSQRAATCLYIIKLQTHIYNFSGENTIFLCFIFPENKDTLLNLESKVKVNNLIRNFFQHSTEIINPNNLFY